MSDVTTPPSIRDVEEQLRHLTPQQLTTVAQFVRALTQDTDSADRQALLSAAGTSLSKDWNTPEEDAAWADL